MRSLPKSNGKDSRQMTANPVKLSPREIGKIIYRSADAKDLPGNGAVENMAWIHSYISPAHNITAADIFSIDFMSDEVQKIYYHDKFFAHDQYGKWVACRGAEIVGYCIANNTKFEIEKLYVSPYYQGQGIGRQLLQTAINWLGPNHGINVLVLTYLGSTINFYHQFGFKTISQLPQSELRALPSGKRLPNLLMFREASK